LRTVSDKVTLKKAKLSSDGEKVAQVLQREYGMTREAAIRLIRDGGPMFAVAMLTRRGMR
jgi:hypothetical protein